MDLGAGFRELDLFMADLRGARARAVKFNFNKTRNVQRILIYLFFLPALPGTPSMVLSKIMRNASVD
jgi:hypothetical protein